MGFFAGDYVPVTPITYSFMGYAYKLGEVNNAKLIGVTGIALSLETLNPKPFIPKCCWVEAHKS